MKTSLLMGLAALSFSVLAASGASAETASVNLNESTASLPPAQSNLKNIDEEITNPRLRAATGSQKRISVQSSFNYEGGSMNDPLTRERPQLAPGLVPDAPTKITGLISGKWRISDHDNLNVGVGVGWATPGHEGQRGQSENPYASYGRVFKSGKTQNSFGLTVKKYTADFATSQQQLNWEGSLGHTFLWDFGNRLQGGTALQYTRRIFNEEPMANTRTARNTPMDTIGAFPYLEYLINDRLQVRTVYRGLTWINSRDRADEFNMDVLTQSTGLGITLTRDIWLYPNIQWVWEDLRADKTNIGINANINL